MLIDTVYPQAQIMSGFGNLCHLLWRKAGHLDVSV